VKYAPSSQIAVTVGADEQHAQVQVTDVGIGMSPEELQLAFERFGRAVSRENYGGLGLGLYLAREIVRTHGGALDVESEPGRGTRFTLRLPREQPGAN
jgi:signal transduction histidine kinase